MLTRRGLGDVRAENMFAWITLDKILWTNSTN